MIEQLEHKHMISYGTILAMDVVVRALIETHPEKDKLRSSIQRMQLASEKMFESTVLRVDDVSPNTIFAFEQFRKMLLDYQGIV